MQEPKMPYNMDAFGEILVDPPNKCPYIGRCMKQEGSCTYRNDYAKCYYYLKRIRRRNKWSK